MSDGNCDRITTTRLLKYFGKGRLKGNGQLLITSHAEADCVAMDKSTKRGMVVEDLESWIIAKESA